MKMPMFVVGVLVGAVLGIADMVIHPALGLWSPLLGICFGFCAGGVGGIFTLKHLVFYYQQNVRAKSTMCLLTAYFGVVAAAISGAILGIIVTVVVCGEFKIVLGTFQLLMGIFLGALFGGLPAVFYVRRFIRELKEIRYVKSLISLPENAANLIKSIIGQMRYRKEVQDDVMTELTAHFEDELQDCETGEEKEQRALSKISAMRNCLPF